jgi:hypothetical protein
MKVRGIAGSSKMAIVSEALMHLWERPVKRELNELRLRTLRESIRA